MITIQQLKQQKNILLLTLIVAVTFVLAVGLKVGGILFNSAPVLQEEKMNVTVITSDVISDQSWGSLAYKGKLKIEEQFPVTVSLHSEVSTNELIEETVTNAITEGSRMIIGHGREFSEIFTKVAPMYTDVHFVTIHGTSKHSNQSVYSFDQGEIEYFAALTAALKTGSKKVAIIDAFDGRYRNPQFEMALRHYKPEATFFYRVVDSRDDGVKASAIAKELIQQGVDIIYTKGNAYNRDVIEQAKKHNVYVIGYLDDQSYLAENHVLTSVMNDVSQAYVAILRDFFSEEGIHSGKVMLTESDGVYKLAPFGPMFTKEQKQFIKSEMKKFKDGELEF